MPTITAKPQLKNIATIGIDTSKKYVHVHAVDSAGHTVIRNKRLSRDQVLTWFAQLPPCTIGLEACGASHYWARELTQLGHTPKIMAAEHVAAYRQGRGTKNDANDAEACCEAVSRPRTRFVGIKSEQQQAVLSLHRVRKGYANQRTEIINRLRGLLGEFGHWFAQSPEAVLRAVPVILADHDNPLPDLLVTLIHDMLEQLRDLDSRIDNYDQRIKLLVKNDPIAKRVGQLSGVGPLTASAVVATCADPSVFKNGRQFAAWIGLTPKQFSTGGQTRLGRITKHGDSYLRSLLVQGARSTLQASMRKNPDDRNRLQLWIVQLHDRVGYHKTLTAIANKHARIIWAIMAKGEKLNLDAWRDYLPTASKVDSLTGEVIA